MIVFLTQYYRGLGHCMRTKFIAEEAAKTHDVLVVDQLFDPPISYDGCERISFLKAYIPTDIKNIFNFIMSKELVLLRKKEWIKILDTNDVKLIICEGFPFCRHQFSHEYFSFFEEAKKRGIKLIISARDFPWDEPHQDSLQDWVAYTQNIVCKYYTEKVLIHGDPNYLPLVSDRVRMNNPSEVIQHLSDKIIYTGYVCNEKIKPHKKTNNNIFVSTGLNKEEGMLIFKEITKIADQFPEYKFIMPIANRYLKNIKTKTKNNVVMVPYIKDMYKLLSSCALYITYGGYNSTMEILKSNIPAIIIPRTDGEKLEQFVRAYTFESYNFFKVVSKSEFIKLPKVINECLTDKKFPIKNNINLQGVKRSADAIREIYLK
jgi:predicted glycosyltransferase